MLRVCVCVLIPECLKKSSLHTLPLGVLACQKFSLGNNKTKALVVLMANPCFKNGFKFLKATTRDSGEKAKVKF